MVELQPVEVVSSKPPLSRWAKVALFWTLFIGIGALVGTAMMWFIPDLMGMNALLPFMERLPFPSFFFRTLFWPGLALLLVNGVTQLITAALILKRNPFAPHAALACGLILMAWIVVQFVIFPMNPTSTAYFVFGALQAITAWRWLRLTRLGR